MKSKALNNKLNDIIQKPITDVTKSEAEQILKRLGVLDDNGEITPAYQDIIVKKKQKTSICRYFTIV